MSGLFAAAASAWEKATDTVAAYSLPELEVKVREATNSDPWGPTGPQMKELSRATSYYQDMHTVMDAIWRRMAERDKNWRFAYKSLLLIDYILRNGAEQVIPECRRHSYDIQALMSFNYIDENDKDQGINVRERAKHVFELLSDDSRLRDEREKAQKNTGKFDTAISSDSYGGGGGGGYGGYGGGGGGGGRGGEYPGARNYGNRAESGSTYTGGGNPRSANDRFGDDDYAPRRAAASNPSRAPPTHLSDEEDAPRPARAAAAAPAKASTAPKVVIAPVSAPAPAPAPAAPPKNIFDMDFPAPASAPTPASSTSFFPSAPQQQTSFFPSAPAAQQEDFFNPRGAGAGAKPVAPTVAASNDAFGDFVTAPPPPSAQPTGGPAPKDDGDPWAYATLFKGITNKPEAKAAPSNAPKATLGQLSKAAPATVPPLNYTPGPTVMPTAYPTMASYPGAPVMTPMMAAPMNPMMAAPMGAAPVAYVPAGGYMMQPAYAPGNPALR